jgi:hypothetical protein
MDIEKAVKHLDESAEVTSTGYCARYVRQAIEAGGLALDSKTRPVSAKDYGPYLERHGFSKVVIESGTTYAPVKGDIVVIDPYPAIKDENGRVVHKAQEYGHIQMWDGERWVSDFKQKSKGIYPGTGYELAKPKYAIYRFT